MPTLKQLGDTVAKRTTFSKTQIERVFDVLVEEISQALSRGEEVRMSAIGSFTVKTMAARTGRNPRTGEPLHIAERRQVRYKMSTMLGNRLNAPQLAATRRRA